jgi:hypothetical protein
MDCDFPTFDPIAAPLSSLGGGFIIIIIVTWFKCLNNEFMEGIHVVLYVWLSLQKPTRSQLNTNRFQGVVHTRH